MIHYAHADARLDHFDKKKKISFHQKLKHSRFGCSTICLFVFFSTPDDNSNSFSDLKISYEAQSNVYDVASITPRTEIKNSPPSSPNSEIAEPHKRNHSNDGTKDVKLFPSKDMHVTHMLGNQLNPSSSVAQKMSDQLFMEMEAHSVYTSSSMDSSSQMTTGPVFPGKQLANVSFDKMIDFHVHFVMLNANAFFRHAIMHRVNRKVHR